MRPGNLWSNFFVCSGIVSNIVKKSAHPQQEILQMEPILDIRWSYQLITGQSLWSLSMTFFTELSVNCITYLASLKRFTHIKSETIIL